MKIQPRLQAFFVHLGTSALIAGAVLSLVFLVWYPGPLADICDVDQIATILILADVVLGPLLTLLVFDPRKKSLSFDLTVIAALQLGAMLYGMHSIYLGRPAFIVFNVDRFDLVTAAEVNRESLHRANARLPHFGPRWVAARLPDESSTAANLLFSALVGGPDLPQFPEHYVEYESERASVLRSGLPLAEVKAFNRIADVEWNKMTHWFQMSTSELLAVPLRARHKDAIVVVKEDDAAIVAILQLNPIWQRPAQGAAE